MTEQEQTLVDRLKYLASSPMCGVREKRIVGNVVQMLGEQGFAATLQHVTEQNRAAIGMNEMIGWSKAQFVLEGRQ